MLRSDDNQKLSIEECRKILNQSGKNYSDDEIEKIRTWIYHISEITLEFLNTKSPSDIHEIKNFLTEKVKNDSGKNT